MSAIRIPIGNYRFPRDLSRSPQAARDGLRPLRRLSCSPSALCETGVRGGRHATEPQKTFKQPGVTKKTSRRELLLAALTSLLVIGALGAFSWCLVRLADQVDQYVSSALQVLSWAQR